MKSIIIGFLLLITTNFYGQDDLKNKILKIFPTAEIIENETKNHYKQEYIIKIDQFLDHEDKSKGTFRQRLFLSHYDGNAPILYVTEGYDARPRHYELSDILLSNQLIVEYRFNGDSKPENYDYKYLTNEQAMEDLHMIRKKFGKLYKKEWVSTGISKGGTTCMMYKAWYPRDVKVAVPYVAPLPDAREDRRMDSLILSVGDKVCRFKIEMFQKSLLIKRDSLLPLIKEHVDNNHLTFDRIDGYKKAFEYAVLEFSFSFWQLGHDCDKIEADMTIKERYDLLMEVVGVDFYSDEVIAYFEPAFYQFMTQNGYYGFIHKPFDALLKELTVFDNSVFGPRNVSLEYQPEFMISTKKRLKKKSKRTLQIQGAYDPWAATGYIPGPKVDALYMVKEKGSHLTRIKDFEGEQQRKIYNALNKWLKTEIYELNKT